MKNWNVFSTNFSYYYCWVFLPQFDWEVNANNSVWWHFGRNLYVVLNLHKFRRKFESVFVAILRGSTSSSRCLLSLSQRRLLANFSLVNNFWISSVLASSPGYGISKKNKAREWEKKKKKPRDQRHSAVWWALRPHSDKPLRSVFGTQPGGVTNIDTLSRDTDSASGFPPPLLSPPFCCPARYCRAREGSVNSVKLDRSHFASCTRKKKKWPPCGCLPLWRPSLVLLGTRTTFQHQQPLSEGDPCRLLCR